MQAGVGIHLLPTRPAQAVEALTTIKQISDQGLTDVKIILGVLRADNDPGQPRTPRGGLDQLEALLDPVRAAGVQPRLTVHGSARPLPAAVDLAAYRIIQEALTNVLRHARARSAWLDLRYEPEQVVIRIRDDGSAASPGQADTNGQDGHGISGMRERALALSGQFTAGPHPDGGFQVRASHPRPGMMTTCARDDLPSCTPEDQDEQGPTTTDSTWRWGMTEPIRVLIADDERLVRAGFRALIDAEPGMVVVGEAADGAAAVDLARQTPPTSSSWTSACQVSTGWTPPARSPRLLTLRTSTCSSSRPSITTSTSSRRWAPAPAAL